MCPACTSTGGPDSLDAREMIPHYPCEGNIQVGCFLMHLHSLKSEMCNGSCLTCFFSSRCHRVPGELGRVQTKGALFPEEPHSSTPFGQPARWGSPRLHLAFFRVLTSSLSESLLFGLIISQWLSSPQTLPGSQTRPASSEDHLFQVISCVGGNFTGLKMWVTVKMASALAPWVVETRCNLAWLCSGQTYFVIAFCKYIKNSYPFINKCSPGVGNTPWL